MNLSYLRCMLADVRVRAVVVGVLVGGAAVAVVVYVRTMCRPGYVPQADVPLWRGTDLPAPVIEDGDGWAPGALLHLAHAVDETTARYWLAMYARRGATWEQQREAWDEWTAAHRSNVHYLHADLTDRPEGQHP